MNVLFICNGNICRSPLAAALLAKKYKENGITSTVSSAGFESYHINDRPDPRVLAFAKKKGLEMDHQARIFIKSDFKNFDRIYVMDTRNYRDVKDLAKNKLELEKLDYLMNLLEPGSNKSVPDPFHTGMYNFDHIFALLDQATDKIVEMAKNN